MKKILLVILILIFNKKYIYCQSEYNNGYKNGYEKGYCHEKPLGCTIISPIPPVPRYNESYESYNDGYNRGFADGLKNGMAQNNSSSERSSRYETTNPKDVEDFIYKPPYELMQKVARQKQEEYENQQIITSENERNKKIKIRENINKLLNIYETVPNKEKSVENGWNIAYATDNNDFFYKLLVEVNNNQIQRIFLNGDEISIKNPSNIINNKSRIVTNLDENNFQLDVYFLENLLNKNSYPKPPLKSYNRDDLLKALKFSTIAIYRPKKFVGSMVSPDVVINNEFIDKIENGSAICYLIFQEGTQKISIEGLGEVRTISVNTKFGNTYEYKLNPINLGFNITENDDKFEMEEFVKKKKIKIYYEF